jgi:hypothetical protein
MTARCRSLALLLMAVAIATPWRLTAQAGRAAGPPQGPPPTAQASAPIDLTGYWVAIVNEDWRWRMVTPPKGDFPGLPLNQEGQRVANAWDPATDGSCLAYGAAGLMRMPGRLHITWDSESALKIETDAGMQTRQLVFGPPPTSVGETRALQGYSRAEWERAGRAAGGRAGRAGGGPVGPGAGSAGGSLKVVTTNLSGGWVRKNGVPYSDQTTLTEYFDRFAAPNGEEWLVVTTVMTDPRYWNGDFITSSHFRKERDGSRWDPTPCRN